MLKEIEFLENFEVLDTNYKNKNFKKFLNCGMPNKKNEAWKYSPLDNIFKNIKFSNKYTKTPAFRKLKSSYEIVIDNGILGGCDVDSDFIDVLNLEDSNIGSIINHENSPLVNLNSALYQDGIYIEIFKNLDKPLHISYVMSGENTASFPRIFIKVKEGVSGEILETFQTNDNDTTFCSFVSEISLEKNANLQLVRLIEVNSKTIFVNTTEIDLEENSSMECSASSLSGKYIKNDIRAKQKGENSHIGIKGCYVGDGKMHVDNTAYVDTIAPNCTSSQLFKGVLDDNSTAAFQGKIMVRRDAQKTDGYQMNRALLLSRNAESNSKPELEIYADDVKCSHGATMGEVDENQLFYMLARGIPEKEAKILLIKAFLQEVNDDVNGEIGDLVKNILSLRVQNIFEK